MTDERIDKALRNPAQVFASPGDVVRDDALPEQAKIRILRRWEYDARENQVADDEGFTAAGVDPLLDQVIAALRELGAAPDVDKSAPTRQGGA